jgi:excisionase family DNA binding protein
MSDGRESARPAAVTRDARVLDSVGVREFPVEPDLTPREAAVLAGCSYWTVLAEIERGQLVAYRRPGNRLAIRRDDSCRWAYGAPAVPSVERDSQPEPAIHWRRRSKPSDNASALRDLEQRRGAA